MVCRFALAPRRTSCQLVPDVWDKLAACPTRDEAGAKRQARGGPCRLCRRARRRSPHEILTGALLLPLLRYAKTRFAGGRCERRRTQALTTRHLPVQDGG